MYSPTTSASPPDTTVPLSIVVGSAVGVVLLVIIIVATATIVCFLVRKKRSGKLKLQTLQISSPDFSSESRYDTVLMKPLPPLPPKGAD